jgi:ABC-type uncharacterized transport system involved in gliding motility auxiliary subunit
MAVLVGIILGIMVLINYLSYKHHKRFDTTAMGKYSLSDQTQKVLESLPDKLQLIMFDKPGADARVKVKELLTEYKYRSDKLDIQYIDPDQQPLLATKYNVQRYGTLVLDFQGRQRQIEQITEAKLTNAILKITKGKSKVAYFLSGHGEADIEAEDKTGYSLIKQALLGQNYAAKKLLLMREAEVPEDCVLLVVAGPKTPLIKEELQAIEAYLAGGGKAFFLVDPVVGDKPETGLSKFLAKWGVAVGKDVIIDFSSRLFSGDYFTPVITMYADHPITRDFKVASFFPLSRSISPGEHKPDNVTVQTLASTGHQNSWAESEVNGPYEYTEGKDRLGPVSVAVAVDIKPQSEATEAEETDSEEAAEEEDLPKGRLVVFGDSDFVNNTYLNLSGNRDLFLNAVSWLAEEEDLISIRPKSDVPRTISLTSGQMQTIFYLSLFLLPVLSLVIGTIVWIRRRRL